MIIGVGVKKRVSVNYTLTKIQMKKEARVLVNQKIFGIGQDKQGLLATNIDNKPEKFKSNVNQGDFDQPKTRVHLIARSHQTPAIALFLKN